MELNYQGDIPTNSMYCEAFLRNEGSTLSESYTKMCSEYFNQDIKIPFIVWLMENPRSPISLSGAVTLYQHDMIHCLLGRGITQSDESFIIGFTMGSDPKLNRLQIFLFKLVSKYLYPKSYKFSNEDLAVFDQAVKLARSMVGIRSLAEFHPDKYLNVPIGEIRREFRIDKERMLEFYTN